MSITVTTAPKKHAGARNPVTIALNTNNHVETAGTAQVVNVADVVPRTAGQTITLTIGDEELVITFDATPDLKENQVRPYTNNAEFDNMISDLQALPWLSRYVSVSGTWGSAPQHIIFTQNTADEDHELEITSWPSHTKTVTDAVNGTLRPNFKILVDVYAQPAMGSGADSSVKIGTVDGIPDDNGDVVLEIQKAFGGYLKAYAPQNTDAIHGTNGELHTAYWLQYAERYGVTPVTKSPIRLGETNDYYVMIRGGMRWNLWDADTVNDDYFAGSANKFFTNAPDSKIVNTTEPTWLYFYHGTTETRRIQVTVTFSDNSTDTFTTYSGSVSKGGLSMYAVGYSQLDIPGNVTIPSGEIVKSYAVKVENSSGVAKSEVKTYVIDHAANETRYLVFENNWGAMDTLWCKGGFTNGITAAGIDAMGVDDPAYAKNEGPMGTFNTKSNDTFVWNTGFLNRAYLEWLRELADADDCYFVENGLLVKAVVDKASFEGLYSDDLPANGLSIAFKRANFN
jgi:hypothetical protein